MRFGSIIAFLNSICRSVYLYPEYGINNEQSNELILNGNFCVVFHELKIICEIFHNTIDLSLRPHLM